MTITRTRIRCRERACPWPFDEDFHALPWCRGIKGHECFGGVEHQHWPKRSQGGKEIVSLLCSGAHYLIDSGPWGNAVKEINGKRVYMIWDLHGEILYERDIGQEGRNDGRAVRGDDEDAVGNPARVGSEYTGDHEPTRDRAGTGGSHGLSGDVGGGVGVDGDRESRLVGASTGSDEAPKAVSAQQLVSPEPVGGSGVPSAAAEVPDSGSGADALAVAPGASGGASTPGAEATEPERIGPARADASSASGAGASRGLPEERVGRDSGSFGSPPFTSATTSPDSLAQEGRNDGEHSVGNRRDSAGLGDSGAGDRSGVLDGPLLDAGASTGERETPTGNLSGDASVARSPADASVSVARRKGGDYGTAQADGNARQDSPPYTFGDNGIEWEPEFTFDDWARAAERVMKESVGRQWRVGDLVNAERWAECSQFFDDLGYPPETQANYGRISAAYKLAERRPISFGHHQAVYKHPARKSLLDLAVESSWTVKELKLEAYPDTRIRIRRFTIEELRGLFQDWLKAEQRNRYNVGDFLDWLEKA